MKTSLAIFFFLGSISGYSQLTGIKTIPGDYATLADAVTTLNTSGVGPGGVQFNINAGYTETSDIPAITATGTASNPIVFQKSGTGANPKFIPLGPGTKHSFIDQYHQSTDGDAIITIVGGDHMTFDGIDLQTDPAFTGTGMMDFGFYFKRVSEYDGCQYITIKNCSITLNNPDQNYYPVGIYSSNILGTTFSNSFSGNAGYNKIYNDTINNCYEGLEFSGNEYNIYNGHMADINNEIGIDGGNTIKNYTGNGIYCKGQNTLKIANNIINNGVGNYVENGIYLTLCNYGDVMIYSNDITLTPSNNQGNPCAIFDEGNTGPVGNTVSIYNNIIQNCSFLSSGNWSFTAIKNMSVCSHINIYGNKIMNSNITDGSFAGIYNDQMQSVSGSIYANIHDNEISGNSVMGTSTGFTGIFSSQFSGGISSISKNSIFSNNASSSIVAIKTGRWQYRIFNNKIYDLTSTGSSAVAWGILAYGPGGGRATIYNNYIGDIKTPNSSNPNSIAGINVASTEADIYYNTIYLNAVSAQLDFGSSCIYFDPNYAGFNSGASLLLENNIIVNTSVSTGTGKTVALKMFNQQPGYLNYNASSNNNLFYAGAPSTSNIIFDEGSDGDQTLADFKTRMAPRDTSSISESPNFLSITGSSPQFLHINPAILTDIESGGKYIAGYDIDYDGDLRQGNSHYTGTGLRPDIGADEFNGTRINALILPLTLTVFNVSHSGPHQNMVSWSTSQENNTNLFVIERSNDGRNFSPIGKLPAAGNSNVVLNYNFTDSVPLKGINYYRLKIIDKDYKIKYSEIKSLKNIGSINFSIFPNPVNNMFKIVLNAEDAGMATFLINDQGGRTIVKKQLNFLTGTNIYNIEVNNIAKGIYIIKLQLDESTIVKKLSKM